MPKKPQAEPSNIVAFPGGEPMAKKLGRKAKKAAVSLVFRPVVGVDGKCVFKRFVAGEMPGL